MRARSVKPRRQVLNPDQIPLLVPDSDWVGPSELPSLQGVDEFALDTENKDEGLSLGVGPGWATGKGRVAAVSIAWREEQGYRKIYVPVSHPDTENFDK